MQQQQHKSRSSQHQRAVPATKSDNNTSQGASHLNTSTKHRARTSKDPDQRHTNVNIMQGIQLRTSKVTRALLPTEERQHMRRRPQLKTTHHQLRHGDKCETRFDGARGKTTVDRPVMLNVRSAYSRATTTIIRKHALVSGIITSSVSRRTHCNNIVPRVTSHTRTRTFIPYISGTLTSTGVALSSISTVTMSTKPNLTNYLTINISNTGSLT